MTVLHKWLLAIVAAAAATSSSAAAHGLRSFSANDLSYYTRESCEALGFLPKWSDASYSPATYFEKIFKSPLAIDLLAAAHSGNDTGFEQVTADWGCDYNACYGSPCESEGLYDPGAKDPAGGGCPRGPVRVYEDLTCAIRLGLNNDRNAFTNFCGGSGDVKEGTFECLAFFANVLLETASFSQMEERDPRPYCWDRSGSGDCCPAADHQPCLPDSDHELSASEYPSPSNKWLTEAEVSGKCCSYHGRGPLQVSYEPNYKALSEAMLGDSRVLLNYPYKLDADGVAGWTAALWFWFEKHPAQVGNKNDPDAFVQAAPRDRLLDWRNNGGLPGVINIINGAECTDDMDTKKAYNRVSYFYAIARRLNAKPPGANPQQLDYYALPGTPECAADEFCSAQFHNSNSECHVFRSGVDCTSTPYNANISTPMGFNRVTTKLTQIDGQTPMCTSGFSNGKAPAIWAEEQGDLEPIPQWEKMLDVTVNNVCAYVQLVYSTDGGDNWCTGKSEICNRVCWTEQSSWGQGQTCPEEQYQKPCQAMAEWVSRPTPVRNWESQEMGGYMGGVYYGRVGPGLVMALNGAMGFADRKDHLCYWYGATRCHWNIAMPDNVEPDADVHNCRVFPPGTTDDVLRWVDPSGEAGGDGKFPQLRPGEFPEKLQNVISYWDRANCPPKTGKTIVEKLFPRGFLEFDMLFSAHYSATDGFGNSYWDDFGNKNVNKNQLGLGKKGPQVLYDELTCALELGIPSDPDIFMKRFGFAQDLENSSDIPKTLSDAQKRFAAMEFAAFFANVIKETGNFGQAEEQDPRKYCNDQGGSQNPCCPNEWGNNPMCFTTATAQNTTIPPEELERSLGQNATCCTYHGRGFLQVSYEKNYGDLGSVMLKSEKDGVDEDLGRRFAVNFPQFIDAFGVMGWVSSLMYWLEDRPCQYCYGRNTTTLDWNAPSVSPHKAMQNYTQPGSGLGLTFTIINGQECEAAFTRESDTSLLGAHDRLSMFYNLVYRMNVGPPGESSQYYPLPGTKECANSEWCQGTFGAADPPLAAYRQYGGGCWALTAQPGDGDSWYSPYCTPHVIQGGTKLGSRLETVTLSMYKPHDGSTCEILGERFCGVKKIHKGSEPSMTLDPQLQLFTKYKYPALDHDKTGFEAYIGLDAKDICRYVQNSSMYLPAKPQTCMSWCQASSGALQCIVKDDKTCFAASSNVPFIECANDRFKKDLASIAGGCSIPVYTAPLPALPDLDYKDPSDPNNADCGPSCNHCVAASGLSYEDAHCDKCKGGQSQQDWPCSTPGFCECA